MRSFLELELESRLLEWRSAGTGLCSYHVIDVDGSCAKHLTVECYTVVMLLTFILIIISIPSPLRSFIPGLKSFFSAILPTVAYLFFFSTDSMDSPDCLPILCEHIRFFYFFSFSVFHFLVVGSEQ